ncbi:MAG: DEAD/DEAH box helicase [Thermoguttaceae bacterium]|nr:DEAD/DEAH box helicase [Thermoguttaceae bacterium]
MLTRDEIAEKYLATIPYELYPVQEEALLAWFSSPQGVLVCAPTGTGKTLIAEAAVYEALQTGQRMYYTTPLIALTDQKFRELRESAVRWGFSENDIGLVTGNHKVNPNAKILVVVAEILFNRLLHPEEFDEFRDVQSVVMDEFHNFNDAERGIVWEFSLALLPQHVRLLLLSATVGNAVQFANWLEYEHHHKLEVVQSDVRKVPLVFQWVGDQTLVEEIQLLCLGNEDERMTPTLVFCFNRDECWRVAEEIRGKELVTPETRARLMGELGRFDFSQGAGPKLKQILVRGVGVHHAGILPKYRRIVEYLFQQKLLAVCTCTETLSAGINLPARSVVLPSIMKGPAGKQTMLEPGTAHQIFGRAGRPQYDTQGHVFVLAHEDDVEILRWQEKFNRLPADSKDPKILAEKKALKKKQPKRNPNLQYWTEQQFLKLKNAPAGNLESKGLVPWRMLAYMLKASPEVTRLRELVQKRLLFGRKQEAGQKDLDRMLGTLWSAGYVRLEPEPPAEWFPSLPRPDVERVRPKVSHEVPAEAAPESVVETPAETSAEAPKLEIPTVKKPDQKKNVPSLEMWKATRGREKDAPDLNVPKAAKKHVSKPKQTGFGAGLFDDLLDEPPVPNPEEDEVTKRRALKPQALFDVKKPVPKLAEPRKLETPTPKKSMGFGFGLEEEPETKEEPKEEPKEAPAGDILAGLTFGGGLVQPPKPKKAPEPAKPAPVQPAAESKPSTPAEPPKPEPEPAKKPWVFVNGAAVLESSVEKPEEEKPVYLPQRAIPTPEMEPMAQLRGIHPIFGTWILNFLPHADRKERLQAFESILELPSSLGPAIRVPYQEDLPRGRLAVGWLDGRLLDLGLATEAELIALTPAERKERREAGLEPVFTLTFAEKLYRLFLHENPLVTDLKVWPCWVAGEVLRFNGKFNQYISAKGLQKQEGMIFRHLLRLVLLLGEFLEVPLPTGDPDEWRADLEEIIEILTKSCEAADPSGTRQMLEDGLR